MLWWRFRDFISLWWRLFAWGQSRTAKVIKVLGLVFTAIGIPALLNSNLSFNLLLNETPHVYTVSVGKLIAGVLLVAWALITGALAWERSGVPELTIEDELVADRIGANTSFRLGITAKQKDFETAVRLLEILDEKCVPILPGRFPIELEWTHHPTQGKVELKAGIKESVSVAMMKRISLGDYDLCYTGARHGDRLNLKVGDKAYYHVRIEHRKPTERWFCFEKLDNITIEAKRSGPPTPA